MVFRLGDQLLDIERCGAESVAPEPQVGLDQPASVFLVHVFGHPVIYPYEVRQQHRRGDEEHSAQSKHGRDGAAGQWPQRVAEKHRRRGDAVDRAAFGSRDKPPDHRIGGRQNAANE
jgi:hypothetical protein